MARRRVARIASALAAGVAVLVGALWVASRYTDLLVAVLPVEVERRWTDGIRRQAQAATPEGRAETVRGVGDLAARIVVLWPELPYREVRVGVLEREEGGVYALPGGVMLVSSGLLDVVSDEDALAYVVAHEIGHLRERDHLRVLGRRLAMAMLLEAGGASADRIGQVLLGAGLLSDREFSPKQEEAADRFALATLERMYGHVGGAAGAIEAMAQVGWPSAHLVASPRRAVMRVSALRRIAVEESWDWTDPAVRRTGAESPDR